MCYGLGRPSSLCVALWGPNSKPLKAFSKKRRLPAWLPSLGQRAAGNQPHSSALGCGLCVQACKATQSVKAIKRERHLPARFPSLGQRAAGTPLQETSAVSLVPFSWTAHSGQPSLRLCAVDADGVCRRARPSYGSRGSAASLVPFSLTALSTEPAIWVRTLCAGSV